MPAALAEHETPPLADAVSLFIQLSTKPENFSVIF